MEGINILNTEEILITPGWVDTGLIVSAVVLILSMIVAYISVPTNLDILYIIATATFILSAVSTVVFAVISGSEIEPTGKYRYEATIDDSVKMTELYEHYNVVEQRGDIWILEDKE